MANKREDDVVVFGATRFTGQSAAPHLAGAGHENLRWAVAGRRRDKLERVRKAWAAGSAECTDFDLLIGDAGHSDALRVAAKATKVVITTVWPYIHFGEPLAAGMEFDTGHVDLTGDTDCVEISKRLAESALCLAEDRPAQRAGAITPTTAMGSNRNQRSHKVGMAFRVVESA